MRFVIVIEEYQNPLSPFLFVLKNSETKRQYSRNLKLFFDFRFERSLSLDQQASLFVKKAKDIVWTTNYFMEFLRYQIENRVNKNSITPATLKNYFKAAKLLRWLMLRCCKPCGQTEDVRG